MVIAIDKRLRSALFISTALWMVGAILFGLGDRITIGTVNDWNAFDKINDRVFNVALLSIASFAFNELRTRLLCYATMTYVIIRGYLEIVYIYNPFSDNEVYWVISAYWCVFVLMSYIIWSYVGSKKYI